MPLRAADRITVAKPTEPHTPTAMSAQFTVSGLPRNATGPMPKMPRMAFSSPVFWFGKYTKLQMTPIAVAAIAIGRKTIALMIASYRTRVAMTAMSRPRNTQKKV
jgi:hypothetical protein